jgi:very-short-patch-repair endonuclease
MPDIWHQTATSLNSAVDHEMWKLRESKSFSEMGSEIERAFAATFELTLRIGGVRHLVDRDPPVGCGFFLIPQFEIAPYRVDFLFGVSMTVKDTYSPRTCIAIECDGHQWHEATKAQAARDKKRDRFLQTKFGAVLHFTGSEIYRDPGACLGETIQTLTALHK